MRPSRGTKAGIAAGIAIVTVGLTLSFSGDGRGNFGFSLTAAACTLIILMCIHAWVVDTSEERAGLTRAVREAAAQERKAFALQAANEAEMARLRRDMNAERAAITRTLHVERAAMEAEFEERRLEVSKAAFREGVLMERSGMLKPDVETPPANLIQFPKPEPAAERSREHGFVSP